MNADTLLKQANLLGTQSSNQTGVAFTPINSSSLAPATPIAVPTPAPTPNPATPIIASAQAYSDAQAQKDAQANVDRLSGGQNNIANQRNTALSGIADLYAKITGVQKEAAQPNPTLDTANKDLANLNTQIADVNVAYRGETEGVRARGDITKEGQQGLQQNIDAKYGRQLADLAIRQSAAQGNVTALQTASDRKLALTLAPLQTEVSYYKDFLLKNLDTLSTEEQNKVQQIITEKNRLIDKHTTDQNIGNVAIKTALDNGVKIPDNVVAQITANPKDAYNILARNGISLQNPADTNLKNAQAAKLYNDINASKISANGVALPQDYSSFLAGRTPQQTATFNALPPADQSVVAQLVSGDALLTDLVKSRGAEGTAAIQRYIQEATAIDPSFSVNTNKVRYNFLQGWNNPNGKASVTRNAINTALGHLADFKQSADALDPTAIRKLNTVKNVLSTETGSPQVLQLRTDINALASEIATIYKGGTQPSEREIANWEQTIASDFSKGQFKGVSDEISKLLSSKITATRYQYSSTMGSEYAQSLIDPEKKQALIDAGIDPNQIVNEKVPRQSSTSGNKTKSGAVFDVAGAKAAGYSDQEIQAYLNSN